MIRPIKEAEESVREKKRTQFIRPGLETKRRKGQEKGEDKENPSVKYRKQLYEL